MSKAKKVSTKDLVMAAEELNEQLGLDPAINLKAKDDVLIAKLTEAAELIDVKEDDISVKTLGTLEDLGLLEASKTAPATKKKAVKSEDEDDDDDEEDEEEEEEEEDEEEEEEEDEEEEKPKAKGKKPAPVPASKKKTSEPDPEEEEEEEEDEEEEKSKAKDKKEEPKKRSAPAAKGKRKEGPSFQEIAVDLVKSKASEKEILKTFTKLYKDKKGLDDVEYVQKRVAIYVKIAKDQLGKK